ncbi:MFS transporter, partial [Pseudoalteromonas sp. CAL494-MNA-CIBAN-0108]
SVPATFKEQLQVVTKPRLLLVYLMTILGYGGTFTAFTYLAPILEQQTGFASSTIGIIMLVYGVSVAVGNIWGGKLADKRGPI